jgi:hypothetical protein
MAIPIHPFNPHVVLHRPDMHMDGADVCTCFVHQAGTVRRTQCWFPSIWLLVCPTCGWVLVDVGLYCGWVLVDAALSCVLYLVHT